MADVHNDKHINQLVETFSTGIKGRHSFIFAAVFLACCQGSKPVLESFSDIQCVFLEDSRRHYIFL